MANGGWEFGGFRLALSDRRVLFGILIARHETGRDKRFSDQTQTRPPSETAPSGWVVMGHGCDQSEIVECDMTRSAASSTACPPGVYRRHRGDGDAKAGRRWEVSGTGLRFDGVPSIPLVGGGLSFWARLESRRVRAKALCSGQRPCVLHLGQTRNPICLPREVWREGLIGFN